MSVFTPSDLQAHAPEGPAAPTPDGPLSEPRHRRLCRCSLHGFEYGSRARLGCGCVRLCNADACAVLEGGVDCQASASAFILSRCLCFPRFRPPLRLSRLSLAPSLLITCTFSSFFLKFAAFQSLFLCLIRASLSSPLAFSLSLSLIHLSTQSLPVYSQASALGYKGRDDARTPQVW